MTEHDLGIADYPLAEKHPDRVETATGKGLDEITVQAVGRGDVTMQDLGITPNALRQQAEIARAAGRPALAGNFERAAEMTALPRDEVMRIYELLRPGRAESKQSLLEAADTLRRDLRRRTPCRLCRGSRRRLRRQRPVQGAFLEYPFSSRHAFGPFSVVSYERICEDDELPHDSGFGHLSDGDSQCLRCIRDPILAMHPASRRIAFLAGRQPNPSQRFQACGTGSLGLAW